MAVQGRLQPLISEFLTTALVKGCQMPAHAAMLWQVGTKINGQAWAWVPASRH